MDAFAGQRIEIHGQGSDECLALAGAHLGDFALVEHLTAHDLDVEMPHLQDAFTSFAHDGERLGQQLVEQRIGLLGGGGNADARAELDRFRGQRFVGKRSRLRLERIDPVSGAPQTHDLAFVAVKEGLEEGHTSYNRSARNPVPRRIRLRRIGGVCGIGRAGCGKALGRHRTRRPGGRLRRRRSGVGGR